MNLFNTTLSLQKSIDSTVFDCNGKYKEIQEFVMHVKITQQNSSNMVAFVATTSVTFQALTVPIISSFLKKGKCKIN